jgi:hypothetical protein
MSGSYYLNKRLKEPLVNNVWIDGSGPLGGWEDTYMINGAHRECHPDFLSIPIGSNPNGFVVCQRKKNAQGIPYEAVRNPIIPFSQTDIRQVNYILKLMII